MNNKLIKVLFALLSLHIGIHSAVTLPTVNAGEDQLGVPLISAKKGIKLYGSVSYTKPIDSITITWSKISGPNGVEILSTSTTTTKVTFTDTGTYKFELRAQDGSIRNQDTVRIVVVPGLPFIVLAPVDTAPIVIGQSYEIKWQMDPPKQCRIFYSVNAERNWIPLTDSGSVGGDGNTRFTWNVSEDLNVGLKGIIKIEEYGNPNYNAKGTFVLINNTSVRFKSPTISKSKINKAYLALKIDQDTKYSFNLLGKDFSTTKHLKPNGNSLHIIVQKP